MGPEMELVVLYTTTTYNNLYILLVFTQLNMDKIKQKAHSVNNIVSRFYSELQPTAMTASFAFVESPLTRYVLLVVCC